MTPGIVLRSSLFAACQILLTPPFSIISLLTFPFNALTRYSDVVINLLDANVNWPHIPNWSALRID